MSLTTKQRNPKLMAAMAAVNKAHGAGTMALASEVAFSHLKRIPTGIFALDVALGGGLPKGRIIMAVGEEAVGKTSVFLRVAAHFQHTCKRCLEPFEWHSEVNALGEQTGVVVTQACPCGESEPHNVALFDSEGHFDPAWAASLGVDVPALWITQPQHAEQGVDVVNKLMRTGELDLVGIDSVAMMTPGREIEQGAESGQRPDLALIWNKAMRTFQASLNSLGMDHPNKPAIYMVNQFREKVGVMYGDPRTWPGGKGQNFASSIILSLRAGKSIDGKNVVGGKDDEKIGVELHGRTEKNKTFAPYKKFSFKLYNTDVPALGIKKGDVDNFDQMVSYGMHLGVIPKGGAWYDLAATFGDEFKNPLAGTGKFQGEDAVIAFLKADPAKARVVREKILEVVKQNDRGIPSSTDD